MQSLFHLIAALLVITALFAWLNHRFLRLPANVGLLVMGLLASLLLIAADAALPGTGLQESFEQQLNQIDFYDAVMNGMLAFLLFAGALQIDLARLRGRAAVVATLALAGTALSMVLVAAGLWALGQLLQWPISFSWCLVYGALISPTDPVAVLSTLKHSRLPKTLEVDIACEALFNDGIGVVLFTVALAGAVGGEEVGLGGIVELLVVEAGGGALFGLVTGYIAYRAVRAIDDYSVEVLVSLALVTGTYAAANALGLSGPIAVVVAGVLIGNHGVRYGMSERTRAYMLGFWTLVDEILNAVLFLLIGVEVLLVRFESANLWLALCAIPLALAARALAVAGPVAMTRRWNRCVRGTIPTLTWAGVHGGISIALALSLPDTPARGPIVAATYAVVLFTVIVQGLSLSWAVRRFVKEEPSAEQWR